jgi:hypothetical protein
MFMAVDLVLVLDTEAMDTHHLVMALAMVTVALVMALEAIMVMVGLVTAAMV